MAEADSKKASKLSSGMCGRHSLVFPLGHYAMEGQMDSTNSRLVKIDSVGGTGCRRKKAAFENKSVNKEQIKQSSNQAISSLKCCSLCQQIIFALIPPARISPRKRICIALFSVPVKVHVLFCGVLLVWICWCGTFWA